MMLLQLALATFVLELTVEAFVQNTVIFGSRFARTRTSRSRRSMSIDDPEGYADAAKKFKILVCSSTSCARKREILGMDEYETLANMYSLVKDSDVRVSAVEECPCLGSCDFAPCIAIEHDDFVGPVALEGMTESEFAARS